MLVAAVMFARRVPHDLRPNRLAQARTALALRRVPVLDLTVSNPTEVGLVHDADAFQPLSAPAALRYEPEPFGLPAARAAVAEEVARQGTPVGPERIVLTSSTSEAYSHLFKLLCDPGDAVLVPAPSYPLFEHLARLDGVQPVAYLLEFDGVWAFDPAAVESVLTPATRALIVVSPNNPTGTYLRRGELDAVAALCRDRGMALVGDEVFYEYAIEPPRDRAPVLAQRQALTFSLGGLSKSAGLPQVKLGWMAVGGPEAMVSSALSRLEVIADTYLSVSTPVQHAAAALVAAGAGVRRRIQSRVTANLGTLRRHAAAHPACRVLPVEGGWSAVIQVPALRSEEDLVLELLEKHHVLVHPGYFFDFPREAFVVVSLLPAPEVFADAVVRVLGVAGG